VWLLLLSGTSFVTADLNERTTVGMDPLQQSLECFLLANFVGARYSVPRFDDENAVQVMPHLPKAQPQMMMK
jgi:hypothetical protein